MMDNQREILNKNINSLKETMDLITERIKIIEETIKINDNINKDNNEELKEVMKEDIKEVMNNTNEEPKKRGRKPKKLQGKGNEWAAELNKAEPDKKPEIKRHINKNYSYYKNSYTPEQRELCKERSRERYYKLKALKEGNNEVKRGRGRPRKQ